MAAFNDNGVQMDTWQNPKNWPKHNPLNGAPTGETSLPITSSSPSAVATRRRATTST